jgi:hypothetical protein
MRAVILTPGPTIAESGSDYGQPAVHRLASLEPAVRRSSGSGTGRQVVRGRALPECGLRARTG